MTVNDVPLGQRQKIVVERNFQEIVKNEEKPCVRLLWIVKNMGKGDLNGKKG